MAKALPDLDKGHLFYSDEANKDWLRRQKLCEAEEKMLVVENRKRYKNRNKKVEDIDAGE
jgi:hypothetical protein